MAKKRNEDDMDEDGGKEKEMKKEDEDKEEGSSGSSTSQMDNQENKNERKRRSGGQPARSSSDGSLLRNLIHSDDGPCTSNGNTGRDRAQTGPSSFLDWFCRHGNPFNSNHLPGPTDYVNPDSAVSKTHDAFNKMEIEKELPDRLDHIPNPPRLPEESKELWKELLSDASPSKKMKPNDQGSSNVPNHEKPGCSKDSAVSDDFLNGSDSSQREEEEEEDKKLKKKPEEEEESRK